jgi:hypothetical protein
MGALRSASVSVDLVRVLELLRAHITSALCQTVFATTRTTERQRRWTLEALVQFWLAVILRAPRALSQALYETLEGSEPLFPLVQATPEAFFQRCQTLRPAFFAAVFARFTAGLLTATPARYAQDLAAIQARFAGVVVVDGSRLAAIAHRLQLLRAERAVVLPGCLLAVYDLGRGLCRSLDFCADAAAGELARAQAALGALPRETLVLADRLYGNGVWFATLAAQGCWGLVRQNRRLGLRKVQCLTRCPLQGGRCTDWLVATGGTRRTPPQRLRYIRWQRGATVRAVLTNVLDPTRLSAPEALALYGQRWSIERLFFDLKEVLNLNRVYAGNPNAIAMQVYAAGCVYNALRVAQADVAEAAGIAPRSHFAGQVLPEDGGGVPLRGPLRAVVPRDAGREPGTPALPAPRAGAPVRPAFARRDSRGAADRATPEAALLQGPTEVEVAGACTRRS